MNDGLSAKTGQENDRLSNRISLRWSIPPRGPLQSSCLDATEAEGSRALNAVLDQIISTGKVQDDSGQQYTLHSHVSTEQGEFLQSLIREIDARTTLEVGVGYGISGLFICDALRDTKDARHYLIDPMQYSEWWHGVGLKNLRDAGYGDMIEFRELPSHLALPQLELEGVKLDFAFIDGWHTFDNTLLDFFLVDRLLKPGGIVAIDDTEWPSVNKTCRYIATNRKYKVLRCLGKGKQLRFPAVRKLMSAAARKSEVVSKLLRAELAIPDIDLGIVPHSRCVAFQKIADDDGRECFGHEEF